MVKGKFTPASQAVLEFLNTNNSTAELQKAQLVTSDILSMEESIC